MCREDDDYAATRHIIDVAGCLRSVCRERTSAARRWMMRSAPAARRTGGGIGHRDLRNGGRGDARFHNGRNGGLFYPLWDDEGYWDNGPYWENEANEDEGSNVPRPAPPMRLRSAARTEPAADPKMIEVPGTADSAAAKPMPPAMFILTGGERLEARRYLLTHDALYVTVDHQERTIPIARLDIDATVVANRQRGVELRIPTGRSEISLSF